MRVVVSGASGVIGRALCARLRSDGHQAVRLVRRAPAAADEAQWDPASGRLDPAAVDGADAVVNLAGAGIGDKRWSEGYTRLLRDSRVRATELLASTVAALERPPTVFLSGSAVGIYGDRGEETLDERSALGTGTLAEICIAWEQATAAAADHGARVAHLRTGIVLARHGGALKKQLRVFRLGLGGRFGSGRQFVSWISLDDEVGAIVHLLTADVRGPVNLTAPEPVTSTDFARLLGQALSRPAILPAPAFALRLVLGRDMADELLLSSQRVRPKVLEASGYEFAHPALTTALDHVLTA